ncbi:hypothetical protein ACFVMC_22195 [Nocardia sp. NPDC127579]|uniref:hypothetical protein n=1 Tax=Nocardia sp. NPDC127579 TaxID=3345402 RepID=UPI00363168B9
MEHGQQGDGESIGVIISGIAEILREVSDKLDAVAARVEDTRDERSVATRLAKLEAWAFRTDHDISKLGARIDGVRDETLGGGGATEHGESARGASARSAELVGSVANGRSTGPGQREDDELIGPDGTGARGKVADDSTPGARNELAERRGSEQRNTAGADYSAHNREPRSTGTGKRNEPTSPNGHRDFGDRSGNDEPADENGPGFRNESFRRNEPDVRNESARRDGPAPRTEADVHNGTGVRNERTQHNGPTPRNRTGDRNGPDPRDEVGEHNWTGAYDELSGGPAARSGVARHSGLSAHDALEGQAGGSPSETVGRGEIAGRREAAYREAAEDSQGEGGRRETVGPRQQFGHSLTGDGEVAGPPEPATRAQRRELAHGETPVPRELPQRSPVAQRGGVTPSADAEPRERPLPRAVANRLPAVDRPEPASTRGTAQVAETALQGERRLPTVPAALDDWVEPASETTQTRPAVTGERLDSVGITPRGELFTPTGITEAAPTTAPQGMDYAALRARTEHPDAPPATELPGRTPRLEPPAAPGSQPAQPNGRPATTFTGAPEISGPAGNSNGRLESLTSSGDRPPNAQFTGGSRLDPPTHTGNGHLTPPTHTGNGHLTPPTHTSHLEPQTHTGNGHLTPPTHTSHHDPQTHTGSGHLAPAHTGYELSNSNGRNDSGLTSARPQPDITSPTALDQPTAEDNAHVDKLQAMLDELKRNPHGPFGRPIGGPGELPA